MITKTDLQSYYWLTRNVKKLEDKLLELETEATRITTRITHQPKSKNGTDKIGGIVAEIIDVQNKINSKLQNAYIIMSKIEQAASRLPEREAYLIRRRYIDCLTWEQIAVDMHYSWQHVHKIHAKALKLLASTCDRD
jgi:DNA-directed RNA polymerase specialized sigma subunit